MNIKDSIMQNEKLALRLKYFSSEIDRLIKLYEAVRTPGREYNYHLARKLKKVITKAKEQFKYINDAYTEPAYYTDTYIYIIEESCREIQDVFLRLDLNEYR